MNKIKVNKYSAELVGILLGDGSINIYESKKYSTYYRVKISFHSEETQYINYVSNLLVKILNEKPIFKKRKNEKTSELLIFKKEILLKFIKLGLINSPKWNRAIIPQQFINKRLGKYVLRGYFDTDGSVVRTLNNGILYPRLEMKIMPSPMQNQLLKFLSDFDFKFKAYQIGKGEVRVQLNGKSQLKKWFDEIGFSNDKHKIKCLKFLETKNIE